jgi:UDP-N-acetylmuramyl pentapeptide phosphotransferase/UDP-N-acetylglucosamine-1-phosphate transferase
VLFLPYVRSWFAAAGLDWAYLAALASAVAFFGVPVLRRVAFGLGVLDNPSARKIHHYATPLLGGAAATPRSPPPCSSTSISLAVSRAWRWGRRSS